MVKTYMLAPNWSTAPPPDGPIKLGHLLDDLSEFVPLNRDDIVEILKLNPVDTKKGFTASRGTLVAGDLGFFAKVLGLVGVGAGADIYYKKDNNDLLSCRRLDTMTFDPTDAYIAESMGLPDIRKFMEGSKFEAPVYMVTGLKIVRGGSLQSSSAKDQGCRIEGGVNLPGSPAQIGGKAGFAMSTTEGESWEDSTDFIMAFRARKIWYDHGNIKNQAHMEKVVMQDGTAVQQGPSMILQSDDDVPLSDVFTESTLAKHTDLEDDEEINWILPVAASEST